jgi:TRAP-type C4-dicarboxylate transport system permease small subunit
MTHDSATTKNPRLARLSTALLVTGFLLFVGGLIAIYSGNQSATTARNTDALSGFTQYGPYLGEWVAMIGAGAAVVGVLSMIGYGITRYINR